MKFLVDQDIYTSTVHLLKKLNHDVICVAEIGCTQATDVELLSIAQKQGRILVTRDRDFGRLVFVNNIEAGVIYIRILPSTIHEGHKELRMVLESYSEDELMNSFVVVEPGRHRIRRLIK